jgi:hypothetical protein
MNPNGQCGVEMRRSPFVGHGVTTCSDESDWQALGFLLPTLQTTVVIVCTPCFNIKGLHILHTQCVCVFRMVLIINSNYFPKQH